jgi:hypothetical protein
MIAQAVMNGTPTRNFCQKKPLGAMSTHHISNALLIKLEGVYIGMHWLALTTPTTIATK